MEFGKKVSEEERARRKMVLEAAFQSQNSPNSDYDMDDDVDELLDSKEFYCRPLTEKTLRDLHVIAARTGSKKVSGYREPIFAGLFRGELGPDEPDYIRVGKHIAPKKNLVAGKVQEWLREYNEGEQACSGLGVMPFAAQMMYRLLKGHFFADANGRVSRCVFAITLRRGGRKVNCQFNQEMRAMFQKWIDCDEKEFVRQFEFYAQNAPLTSS